MYACFLLQNRSDKWVGEESMFLVELHRVSLQFKIMQCRETKKKKKKETNSKRKKHISDGVNYAILCFCSIMVKISYELNN